MMRDVFSKIVLAVLLAAGATGTAAQAPPVRTLPPADSPALQTTEDWNKRLQELAKAQPEAVLLAQEYRAGAQDLLEISVFEAPELNRSVRIASSGEISLPLIGPVRAAGLTARELEIVLEELLRRTYMKDPHVSVFVREMESHSVSVVGAVKKPGVFQIRGVKSVLEMLSMAEGLTEDAGDTVLITRGQPLAGGASTVASGDPAVRAMESQRGTNLEINLKRLLESGDAQLNAPVFAGDVVKVTRAGVIYAVGAVNKAGGFVMKNNESLTVLQVIALSEGLTRYAKKGNARIIRTNAASGAREEIPVNLDRILDGKAEDRVLQARDILFIPDSSGKRALYRSSEAALSIVTGVIVWRR